MTELMAVVAIMSLILLVSVPNLTKWYQRYQVRTNARGVASFLKLARMKAVSANIGQVVSLDAAARTQCPSTGSGGSTFVLHRDQVAGTALECYTTNPRLQVVAFPVGSENKTVRFRPNGMADSTSPNWFLIKSANGRICQMVCVNAVGAVRTNKVMEPCASPYGGPNPCPTPP